VRVSVVGSSGSGKTTFAKELARRIGAPHIELDAIYHQANWTPLPDDQFQARVREAVAADAWVVDGNYAVVRPIVLDRATTVVWLDYPRNLVMARVIRRSIIRAIDRKELWNGNKESVRNWIDPEHPIRWAWSRHHRKHSEYAARFAEPRYAHLDVHQFTSPRAAREWLGAITVT
jgi:adenylate kinase family enzyme